MESAARQLRYREPGLTEGIVTGCDGSIFQALVDGQAWPAKRAIACLLEPLAGDRVLLYTDVQSQGFILSILERRGTGPASISLEGDLEVKTQGAFSVMGAKGVDISSGSDISLVSGGLKIKALIGDVVIEKLSFVGAFFEGHLQRVKLVAESLDTILDRLYQRLKRSYRIIEESDHVRAGSIDLRAEGTVHVRGENTVLTAQELVKIDGEQIHVG